MDRMRSLRQIVTLADAGNFRKAAERLGVTHSALSQAIAKLEDSYGVPLFVRNKKRQCRRPLAAAWSRRHGKRWSKLSAQNVMLR